MKTQHNRNITIGDRECSNLNQAPKFIYHRTKGEVLINFGKHKGKLLSDLPKDYLKWCYTNIEMEESVKDHITQLLSATTTQKDQQSFKTMPYGKYKGQAASVIESKDPKYFEWFKKDFKAQQRKKARKRKVQPVT